MLDNLTRGVAGEFLWAGHRIRVGGDIQSPVFIIRDLCDVLTLNHIKAISRMPSWALGPSIRIDAPKGPVEGGLFQSKKVPLEGAPSSGQGRGDFATVTEAGLYYLILRARSEIAEAFQRWVCVELLPTLRKQGFYVQAGVDPVVARTEAAASLRGQAKRLRSQAREIDERAEVLARLDDGATVAEVLTDAGQTCTGAELQSAICRAFSWGKAHRIPIGRRAGGIAVMPRAAIRSALGLDQAKLSLS